MPYCSVPVVSRLARAAILGAAVACALLLAAVAPIAPAHAEPAPIVRRIDVTGNTVTEADAVRAALAFRAGDALTPERIDRSIKQLFATGLYADAKVVPGRSGDVSVRVVENPRVASVSFSGNKAIETSKLAGAIALKQGAIYTRAKAHADAISLRDLYRREGRHQVKVEPHASDSARGVQLTFHIEEGEVNKVKRIAFSGNRAFSDAVLRDVITTTQSGWLDMLRSNLTYDAERVALDRILLRQYYQKHGYADASVAEPAARLDPATGGFEVSFAIDEGERYTFGPQRIELNLPGIDASRLAARIAAREGQVYDATKVDTTVVALDGELAATGQPFVHTVPRIERDPNARRIGVVYALQSLPHLYIRRIEITGNSRTLDRVVRRELRLGEGDPYSPITVEAARKRLTRTGLFKSIDIRTIKAKEKDQVDLAVGVVEQDSKDLSFGIGYSENDGIIGDIAYGDNNLFGTGLSGRVKLEAGQRRYGAELSLTDPHFLDTDLGAGFDLFYRDTDRTLTSSYKDTRWGGSVRLAMPITETLSTGVNYTFVRGTIYDVGPNASVAIKEAVPGYPAATSGRYDTSAVGYSVAFDTRDNRKMPTSGVYAGVKQDLAGLGGDARYLRTSADLRGYYPLPAGIVLAGHIGGGYITGYGGQDVRLLDLFYRGSETVRGFAPSGLGPRDAFSANQDALGGRSYYVTSAELRFPIPTVPESLGINGMVFADAGSLFGANKTAAVLPGLAGNSAAPRVSAGPGIVWNSPLGPLQASYGFVLAKQPGDKIQPFNFGLGSGF